MKTKTEKYMINTYQTLLNSLKGFGINTNMHIPNNEISDAYK